MPDVDFDKRMKLLLHTCCAPCLIYPLERLRRKDFELTGYFYNPNIHPLTEYKNRKQAVENFATDNNIQIIYPEYSPWEFFQAVNQKETNPGRCSRCWSLRLKKTASEAGEKGFTHFSTTLLVSPYQDQGLLKKIGSEIAKEEAVDFYYEDFRRGFREAHNRAKAQGLYCQKYCGCIYSGVERCSKNSKSKNQNAKWQCKIQN